MELEQELVWRRFELARIYGNYFWEVAIAGNVLHIRFGVVREFTRIARRYFASFEEAQAASAYEIQCKEDEGYHEVSHNALRALSWDGSKDVLHGGGFELWDYLPSKAAGQSKPEELKRFYGAKRDAYDAPDLHDEELLQVEEPRQFAPPTLEASTEPVLNEVELVPAPRPTPNAPLPAEVPPRIKAQARLTAKEEARARARHDEAVAVAQRLLEESVHAQAAEVDAQPIQREPQALTEQVAAEGSAVRVEIQLAEEHPVAASLVPGEAPAPMPTEVEALPLAGTTALDSASQPASLADQLVLLAASVVAAGTALLTSAVWWSESAGLAAETQLQLTWNAAAKGLGLAAPALVLGCLLRARPLRTQTTRWVERACYLAGLGAFALGLLGLG